MVGLIRGVLVACAVILSTLFFRLLILIVQIFSRRVTLTQQIRFDNKIEKFSSTWADSLLRLARFVTKSKWTIVNNDNIDFLQNKYYIILCNHQNWGPDVSMILHTFNKKIPYPRFFIKESLVKVPCIGSVFKLLNYPLVQPRARDVSSKTYSNSLIDSLEKLREKPCSILIFPEGTRFSEKKHREQNSPYQNLLLPKYKGIQLSLDALAEKAPVFIDATIIYSNKNIAFFDLFCGTTGDVTIHLKEIKLSNNTTLNVKELTEMIWKQKDCLLDEADCK